MSFQLDVIGPSEVSPLLTVVVVTHNSSEVIERCLATLGKEDWFECVVVDCGSTDATLDRVQGFSHVTLRQTHNIGYGRGNNLGIAAAQTELVLVLNPDVIIDPDRIRSLVNFYQTEGGNMMLSCKMFQTAEDGTREYRRDSHFKDAVKEEKRLCGALMLMSKEDFSRLGGFDEKIFLYFEEVDLCRRARVKGLRILISGEVEVEHMRAASTPNSISYAVLRGWHDGWSKSYYIRKCANSRFSAALKILKTVLQSVVKLSIAQFLGKRVQAHRETWKVKGMVAFMRGEAAFDSNDRARYLP